MSRSPRDCYEDYVGRRKGILRALTQDIEKFYSLCDPAKEVGGCSTRGPVGHLAQRQARRCRAGAEV